MTWEEISCPLLLSLWAWCNVSSYRNYDSWPKSKLQNTSQFSCLITALLQFHASLLLWELNVFCEDVVYGTGFVLLCWQPAEVLGENPKDWDCRATVRRELFFSFWLIHSSVVLLPLIASIKRHLQIWQADPLLGLKLKPILALGAERAHSRRVKLERSYQGCVPVQQISPVCFMLTLRYVTFLKHHKVAVKQLSDVLAIKHNLNK